MDTLQLQADVEHQAYSDEILYNFPRTKLITFMVNGGRISSCFIFSNLVPPLPKIKVITKKLLLFNKHLKLDRITHIKISNKDEDKWKEKYYLQVIQVTLKKNKTIYFY